jgi:hypothetical protein
LFVCLSRESCCFCRLLLVVRRRRRLTSWALLAPVLFLFSLVEEFWSWGTSLGELHPRGSLKLQISGSSKLEGFRDQRRLRVSKHSKHLFIWDQSHPKDWDFQDGHVDKGDFLSTAGLIRNELGRQLDLHRCRDVPCPKSCRPGRTWEACCCCCWSANNIIPETFGRQH